MIIRRLVVLALVLTTAAFLAACGDDDGGDGGGRVKVTTTADSDERDGEVSLREAILIVTGRLQEADLDEDEQDEVGGTPGVASSDTISFDLEDGAVIVLAEALPPLRSGNDVLDATGEDVTLDGSAADFVCVDVASSENAVYGLWFTGCRTAILVQPAALQNNIGGPAEGQGNVLVDGVVGIQLSGRNNVVQGNHIGVEPGGTDARGNDFEGIWLTTQARDNVIGGPGPGEGNVISGNPLFGISIDGSQGTVVQGNFVGLDTTGLIGVGNHTGINVQNGAFGNRIGGALEGEGNVISGNRSGVLLTGASTTGNKIEGNVFGTSAGQGEGIRNDQDIYYDDGVGENDVGDNVTSG